MKLIEFGYKGPDFYLEDLHLGQTCLIIGKNASGKSTVLDTIARFACIFRSRELRNNTTWKISGLSENGAEFKYFLQIASQQGLSERLFIKNELKITRNGSVAHIYKKERLLEKRKLPESILLAHFCPNLDYLDELLHWCQFELSGLKSGRISTKEYCSLNGGFLNSLPSIQDLYLSLSAGSRHYLVGFLQSMGFRVTEIHYSERSRTIILNEKDHSNCISINEISSSLLRSMASLIFMLHVTENPHSSTILIDDLCQGLDYSKSRILGKEVFKKCRAAEIQLIASTNDTHLIDSSNLRECILLRRKNRNISAKSYVSHKEEFEKHSFTGLSNSDFLAQMGSNTENLFY